MRKAVWLTVMLVWCTGAWALDSSEVRAAKAPLKVYSGGVAAGGVVPLSEELPNALLQISFINAIQFHGPAQFFLDLNWFGPGRNFGADAGFDIVASRNGLGPFIGVGIGAHHFDRDGADFGDDFGPSVTAHVGMQFDLTDQVQVRFRVPYHYVANESQDQMIGLEVGMLFSSRFKKVTKLVY